MLLLSAHQSVQSQPREITCSSCTSAPYFSPFYFDVQNEMCPLQSPDMVQRRVEEEEEEEGVGGEGEEEDRWGHTPICDEL